MVQSSTFILFSLLGTAFAANDWSKPCLSGVCFYDLPKSQDGSVAASGTLKIWGAADSITDITTAAGWEIIDCQKDALSQDIRLVCTGDAKCDHLYQSIGAVGKIVRLPENCGSNAFAHISRAWVPEDQSIPDHISKRLVRRNGIEVKALHLDTNFASVDTAKVGVVNFALTGANIPGAQDIVPFPSSKSKRGLFSKAKKFLKKAVKAVTGLNKVEVDKSKTLAPFEIDKNFNIVDQKVSCPPLEGRLKIDVDAKASAVATIGVAAEGTIIPPKINDFAVTASLSGEINGAINLAAGLSGSVDSGSVKLVEIGIPGLDFPGILTIGPTFRVDARANADLDISADIKVGINYKLEQATLVFPPDSKKAQKQGAFAVGDTPLRLSVSPTIKATGTVEAHLIPSVNLGISALGGLADARIFLELDASAAMSLNLEASAQASVVVNTTPGQQKRQTIDGGAVALPVARREVLDIRGTGPIGNDYFARQVTSDASGSFGGCFEISAGLDVNAGADADFFGLFDTDTKVALFQKDFELFKKCFGNQVGAARRRSLGRFVSNVSRAPKDQPRFVERGLTCAVTGPAVAPETLVDEVIPSADIKPLN